MKVMNDGFEDVPIANLKPHPRNANHGDIGAIQESIEANGFFGAVTANRRTGHILAGNHRYKIAKDQDATTIPVIWVDVDEEAELRILLADNRTARLGHDDETALAELLSELAISENGLIGTGFDGDDLDELIGTLSKAIPLRPVVLDKAKRAQIIRVILNISDLELFEDAIAATGIPNRGEALIQCLKEQRAKR